MAGRFIILALIVLNPIYCVLAQEDGVLNHLATYNMQWTASHPYLMEYAFQPFYSAGLVYETGSGDFRSAFQAERYNEIGFRSQSQKAIKDWKLQGTFSFKKLLEQQQPYLLERASSPIVPFTLADGESNSWSGDQVDFFLSALSPLWLNRLRTHALIRYEVGSGNRNAEPRPLYRHNDLKVEVGTSYSLSNIFKIGIAGSIEQILEENSIGVFAVQDFSLYQLRGISTFTRNTFQSFQRTQKKTTLGVKGFISYRKENQWGFLEFTASSGRYEAMDGIAFPLDAGNVELGSAKINTGHTREISNGTILQVNASWENRSSMATDPIFKAINYDFSQSRLLFNSSLLYTERIVRQIGVNISHARESREETAGRDLLAFQNMEYGIDTDVVIPINTNQLLWLKPSIARRSNLNTQGNSDTEGLLRNIFEQEFRYYGSGAYLPQIQANWLSKFQKNELNVGVKYISEIAKQTSFNLICISIGLLF